jgi:amino acid adenylation domain-containing protein
MQAAPPEPAGRSVFLSHNGCQKPWVRQVAAQWRTLGLKVFFDEDSIAPGEDVVSALERGISESDHVVLVLSGAALASPWVAMEIAMTIIDDPNARDRRLIPIQVEPMDLGTIRPAIRRLNIVNLADEGSRDERYRYLLQSLLGPCPAELPAPPALDPALPQEPASVDTRQPLDKNGRERTATAIGTVGLELTINGNLAEFSPERQWSLMRAIQALLETSDDIRIRSVRPGSIILTLDLSPDEAERLYWAVVRGALEEFGVTDARLLPEETHLPAEPRRSGRHDGDAIPETRTHTSARTSAVSSLAPLPRDGGALPLSFGQERLWLLEMLGGLGSTYHVRRHLRLKGELDPVVLRRALDRLVTRHEVLRTTFRMIDGSPVPSIAPTESSAFYLVEHDLSHRPRAEAGLPAVEAEEASLPFRLEDGPLIRGCLVRLALDDHVLLLTAHQVVSDQWSMDVLIRELGLLYTAVLEGTTRDPLPPLPVQYADFAAWQRAWLSGAILESQLHYWETRLAGSPPLLELPTDHPRPLMQGERGASVAIFLSAGMTRSLQELSKREGVTLFMTLLAAWQLLLSRYSGQQDVAVGTVTTGRTHLETEEMVGYLANTLVIRTELYGKQTFSQLLHRVCEGMLGAFHHQEIPFERLVEALAPLRSLSHTPFFQAMFTLGTRGQRTLSLGPVRAEVVPERRHDAVEYDLTLALEEDGERLAGTLAYRTELFEEGTAERIWKHFTTLLERVVFDPDLALDAVPLMSLEEQLQIVREWNATDDPVPPDLVHELVSAQARRTPDAVAVSFHGRQLTYAELERRSNQLSHHLRRRGVGPEVRVGVCMERSPDMLVALLAVLKAGGAYVPLDPAYPVERLRYMMEDGGVRVLLAEERTAANLPDHRIDLVRLDADANVLAKEPQEVPAGSASPFNLAYVIYTSGSTGRPKGVMVEHRTVAALLHWMRRQVRDEDVVSVLASTSTAFDVSVAEIFGTLSRGGKLVLVENVLGLQQVAPEEDVRLAYMVPSAASELLRAGALPGTIRTVNIAGEALPADLARALRKAGISVMNIYGPTESTVYATCAEVDDGAERITIGRPILNTRVYVLDAALRPVPVGVAGELFLGGSMLARGYLDRPALTAERFVPDPFSGEPGSRLYRTGDRARWTTSGEIDYLGRIDFQVKVRGFRIELGEIEAVLRRYTGVTDSVVVAREAAGRGAHLVAYLVGIESRAVEASLLRVHMEKYLPPHMVPSAFVWLTALPLTPNGKIDRKALPAPVEFEYVAPRTTAERALAGIFAEVLGLDRISANADFFALGGNSLTAVRLIVRIRDAIGVEVPLRAVFEAPSVSEMAAYVDRALND